MSETALELRGIAKAYMRGTPAEVAVLKGADLTLQRGEVVALVAPSGAGKSTLLHIAGLLDTADAGSVTIGGAEYSTANDRRRTEARRREVGFVYQFHHLLPEFTAAENVILPQLADGVPAAQARARADELLGRVGLQNRADHLADEPTGNLDPATSERVFGVLMDLVRETGMAALIATHNPELAARMDRTLHLQGGVLV